jgi:hypothetical protein
LLVDAAVLEAGTADLAAMIEAGGAGADLASMALDVYEYGSGLARIGSALNYTATGLGLYNAASACRSGRARSCEGGLMTGLLGLTANPLFGFGLDLLGLLDVDCS